VDRVTWTAFQLLLYLEEFEAMLESREQDLLPEL
jgi:hypothetical protein